MKNVTFTVGKYRLHHQEEVTQGFTLPRAEDSWWYKIMRRDRFPSDITKSDLYHGNIYSTHHQNGMSNLIGSCLTTERCMHYTTHTS